MVCRTLIRQDDYVVFPPQSFKGDYMKVVEAQGAGEIAYAICMWVIIALSAVGFTYLFQTCQ